VRIGYPRNIGGLAGDVESPVFATAVGLAKSEWIIDLVRRILREEKC